MGGHSASPSRRDFIRNLDWHAFINVRMFGFACSGAWLSFVFLFPESASTAWTQQGAYLASVVALCLVMIAGAVFHGAVARLMANRAALLVAVLSCSAGSFLTASSFAFSSLSDAAPLVANVVGSAVAGGGMGAINLGYGWLYRGLDPQRAECEIPFSFFVSLLIFAVTLALPDFVIPFASVGCPLISAWILVRCLDEACAARGKEGDLLCGGGSFEEVLGAEGSRAGLFRKGALFGGGVGAPVLRIGACGFLVGLADSLANGAVHIMALSEAGFFSGLATPSFLLEGFLVLVVIYGCKLLSPQTGLRLAYRVSMLAMALFATLVPVFGSLNRGTLCLMLVSHGAFIMLFWMILADISRVYNLSSFLVFGVGWGMMEFGMLVGVSATVALQSGLFVSEHMPTIVGLCSTFFILVAYMFMFKEKDIIDLDEGEQVDEVAVSAENYFQEKCLAVARSYGLTPREAEVMMLFAKGRSSSRIQEDLCVSKGTVSTHLRHIYQKMGVHSKQELLDIVENRF